MRVVRPVKDDQGLVGNDLKTPRPDDLPQAAAQLGVGDGKIRRQALQAGQGGGRVIDLKGAGQPQRQLVMPPGPAPIAKMPRTGLGPKVRAVDQGRTAPPTGDVDQHSSAFSLHAADNDRDAGLDDAALLGRNPGHIAAQVGLVVESDLGNRRHQRRQHIGRVQATAEPDLNDRNIDLGPGKGHKGEQRHQFKRGEPKLGRVEAGANPGHAVDHLVLPNPAVAETDAFAEVEQMGRGEQADPVARRVQDGVQQGGG